jgi:hypothetical protein
MWYMTVSQRPKRIERAGSAMGRELDCPRRGTRMSLLSRQSVEERSLVFDEWARAKNVDWYVCPDCDYLELYRAHRRR